ncbi:secreted protein (plasmid) [Legionella adelaidensis]|uniref:Secreted protein n=1 Tax=Legionella adelaidensis TaxID=45056 RepID=A0A0W0R4Q5_9GAMM|nr:DUF885 domain-containing protein [Legionella adelaidensis]KTC66045.1 secreted protein [Legionella adelaidensis]VEH85737.1 secreted protein [Legionella adelaidensis]
MKTKILSRFVGLFLLIQCSFIFAESNDRERENMNSQFAELISQYEESLFNHFPELGSFWGKVDTPLDRFTDYSLKGIKEWEAQEDHFLEQIKQTDLTQLNESEKITYSLLQQTLENNKNARVCKSQLWDVNPAFGWHNQLVTVAQKQPVGNDLLRQKALKRWKTFPQVVDQQIANLGEGMKTGYTAPKPAVERVIVQINLMIEGNIEDSPFFDFARKDNDREFQKEIKEIIATQINPSLQKYIDFLQKEYLPKARDSIGVSTLPEGIACYKAKLKLETTLDISPNEIHALGLHYIKQLKKEVAAIGLQKYETEDMAEVFRRGKEESLNYFTSEQEILNYNNQALDKAKAKVPEWFDLMPKVPGIIKPYPPHRAKTGASGEYNPPAQDGSTPGIFYINTYQPEKRSRIDQEATLFHELIPGHHFQIALQFENTSIPVINRYLWNAGYGEGWALYVERLADNMGLYEDEISRLGMLSNESLRASRLVVDTGIHAFGWTRQQAIDYLSEHTALSKNIIEGEVDRYIMLPGQATSYMLGKLEIENLRALAKEKLADKFDIRQFHNQILKNGVVTLPMLRTQIKLWLSNQLM